MDGMNMTLQCAYCGNEDVKLPVTLSREEMMKQTIKCKCGRFLVREGIMGHKDNVRIGDKVRHIKKGWVGIVADASETGEIAEVRLDGQYKTNYSKRELEVLAPLGR